MRFITKTALPQELSDALQEARRKGWNWEEFGKQNGPAKTELRQFLASEQSGLCAYSELSIREFSCHTEHIKPKGNPAYKQLEFEYTNLVASAPENEKNLPNHKDLFGGHKKGQRYDEALFISPTEPECGRYFQYAPDGGIEPHTDLTEDDRLRAVETIDCLGLQSSRLLINRRKNIFRAIQSQLSFVLDQPEALEAILGDYFEPDDSGCLKPFQSLVRQIAST